MNKRYEFTITIASEAETPEEAWAEAIESFVADPGCCPDEYGEEEAE